MVIIQNGNRIIPTNEVELLRIYLEGLYRKEEIRQKTLTEQGIIKTITTTTTNFNRNDNSIFDQIRSVVEQYDNQSALPQHVLTPEEENEEEKASQSASYAFHTLVDDHIQGNYQQQAETRENGRVQGQYSFDDGHHFITRYYVADKNGFRIIK